ncbi:MAG: hypothetical protein K940chlam2_01827, partial [Chlamydiae bacterium]|nr:hypothetical protein [Chlamydiota bacterium]
SDETIAEIHIAEETIAQNNPPVIVRRDSTKKIA